MGTGPTLYCVSFTPVPSAHNKSICSLRQLLENTCEFTGKVNCGVASMYYAELLSPANSGYSGGTSISAQAELAAEFVGA